MTAIGATSPSARVPADDRFADPERPFVAAVLAFRLCPILLKKSPKEKIEPICTIMIQDHGLP
jgi:hypothetical protein